jgi:hypothetical protein
MLPPDLGAFLFGPAQVMRIYQEVIPQALAGLLPGYAGPLCVDALVHRRADGSPALKPVVELNVRLTMGRIAWEWMQRQPSPVGGRLRVHRRSALADAGVAALDEGPGVILNDPGTATCFLAHWCPEQRPGAAG